MWSSLLMDPYLGKNFLGYPVRFEHYIKNLVFWACQRTSTLMIFSLSIDKMIPNNVHMWTRPVFQVSNFGKKKSLCLVMNIGSD